MHNRLKILLSFTLLLAIALPQLSANAKKPHPEVDTVRVRRAERYEKLFKDKDVITARGDFLTLRVADERLYFEMPLETFGREMLIGTITSKTSYSTVAVNGQLPRTPMHVYFSLRDTTVYLHRVNDTATIPTGDERSEKIGESSYADPLLHVYPVLALNPDSTAVVFDITHLFTDNVGELSPVSPGYNRYEITASMKPAFTKISGIKAFADNAVIKTDRQYLVSIWYSIIPVLREALVDIAATHTVMLLPESDIRPRRADPRIGVSATEKLTFDSDGSLLDTVRLANRWNVGPSDPQRYANGEAVLSDRQITMYLDPSFPPAWREAVREGVLRWNAAFARIGLLDVIRVLDYPADDPQFDPDNMRYSSIRYAPSTLENAEGTCLTHPRTGEIIAGRIVIHNNVGMKINKWRFLQTAQVDPRVRSVKMPDDVMAESIACAAAHEMGHCLGLLHNMAASSAYPVDSLRSAEFTQKYGVTPSIMDYARFNYIAQPGDDGVKLTPPDLGPYDEYAIRWLYTPFADSVPAETEMVITSSWIDEKEGDPVYRYAREQTGVVYDPSALPEDLGDDPIRAGEYGIANLKYICEHIPRWFTAAEDPDASHRKLIAAELAKQYRLYLENVIRNAGGFYIHQTATGVRNVPVPADLQRRSVRWVLAQLRECEWLDDPRIYYKTGLNLPPAMKTCNAVFTLLQRAAANVALCASLSADPYTESDFFDDLYQGAWKNTIENRPLTRSDILMQRSMLKASKMPVSAIGGDKYLSGFDPQDAAATGQKIPTELFELTNVYMLTNLLRIRELVRRRLADGNPVDKPHYRSILLTLDRML